MVRACFRKYYKGIFFLSLWVGLQAASAQPNIVFIMTDDQDADSLDYMPNTLAQLAEQGTRFSGAFVTTPVCGPSRASILRGQYVHNHTIWGNTTQNGGGFPKFRDLGLEQSTIATWLKSAGYQTVLIGKYINGYPGGSGGTYIPPGWDQWYAEIAPDDLTYFNYRMNQNGQIMTYGSQSEDYRTDVESGIAVNFIDQATPPFFMMIDPWAPHKEIQKSGGPVPPVPAPRHDGVFDGLAAPRKPSFNEADVTDKPQWMQALNSYTDPRISVVDELYRKRLESLLAVDDMVGRIINALNAKGVLNNTYIFFYSDNGYHLAEHRLFDGKTMAYEEDIRVPLIVRGPGVPAGGEVKELVLNIDLAPTFAELAGVAPPDFVDGRSLVPLINTVPGVSWRNVFLAERQEWPPEHVFGPPYDLVRTKDYKYIQLATGERELYNLATDPYEIESLHAAVEPALITDFQTVSDDLRLCIAETCRTADALDAVPPTPPAISAQPTDRAVTEGETASFSVTASGTAPLSYQWEKNVAAISGATSATYVTPATTAGDDGASFRVVVTNAYGAATSDTATLAVAAADSAAPTSNSSGGGGCVFNLQGREDPLFALLLLAAFGHLFFGSKRFAR